MFQKTKFQFMPQIIIRLIHFKGMIDTMAEDLDDMKVVIRIDTNGHMTCITLEVVILVVVEVEVR